MDLKKAYYYIICLAALLVLSWGIVDFSGASIGLIVNRNPSVASEQSPPPSSDKESDAYLDSYYQKKMYYDRLWDSLARIVVAGVVFAYCRVKVNRLEK